MSKLEEYRDALAAMDKAPIEYNNIEAGCYSMGVEHGFDAAIALELHVKFGEWANGLVHIYPYSGEYQDSSARRFMGMKQAYQYWLDNIFKPE